MTFSLRVEIIEKPKGIKVVSKKQTILPKNIDEIKRVKARTEGLKESEFIIGTRFMLNWIDKNDLYPFLKKSDKIYQTKYFD